MRADEKRPYYKPHPYPAQKPNEIVPRASVLEFALAFIGALFMAAIFIAAVASVR